MEEATRQIESKFGGGKEDSVISKLGSTTSSHAHNVSSHSSGGLSSSPAISSKHTATVKRERERERERETGRKGE